MKKSAFLIFLLAIAGQAIFGRTRMELEDGLIDYICGYNGIGGLLCAGEAKIWIQEGMRASVITRLTAGSREKNGGHKMKKFIKKFFGATVDSADEIESTRDNIFMAFVHLTTAIGLSIAENAENKAEVIKLAAARSVLIAAGQLLSDKQHPYVITYEGSEKGIADMYISINIELDEEYHKNKKQQYFDDCH